MESAEQSASASINIFVTGSRKCDTGAHLYGPEEDAGQEQGDQNPHPHRQRQQRVAVPGRAEPGREIYNVEILDKKVDHLLEFCLSNIGLVSPLRLQHQPRHDPLQCPLVITHSRQVGRGQSLKRVHK